jgi:hypothetical protein
MFPNQALLRLYKLHPIPIPLSDTYSIFPDVKNDILAISANDNRFAIQLSFMNLLGCHRVNQLFICNRFGVLAKGYNDTCLGSLHNQQFQATQYRCKFEVAPITERVYQLKKHHFLVYCASSSYCSNQMQEWIHHRKTPIKRSSGIVHIIWMRG